MRQLDFEQINDLTHFLAVGPQAGQMVIHIPKLDDFVVPEVPPNDDLHFLVELVEIIAGGL
jgi:hypothetical protein